MHRAPLSPTVRNAFPKVHRYVPQAAPPDRPPASVVTAEQRQRQRSHSIDNTNSPQAGYRGYRHAQQSTVGSRGILRAYETSTATTTTPIAINTAVNTILNGSARLRGLRANHPTSRSHHTAAADHRGRSGYPQIPLTQEQARWFPTGSDDRFTARVREEGPRIHSVNAQKKVRIMSAAEVIPASEAQLHAFPTVAETQAERQSKRPAHLEIPNSNFNRFGSGQPFRLSKELPPTPDMGFDEWGRTQREINPGYTTDARFGSTSDRVKNLRRRSSLPNMKEAAENGEGTFVSSTTNTSSTRSTGIRGFVRKVRLSLTSDKRPPKLQPEVPTIKATPPPKTKTQPKDDGFSWNIFKTSKATNPGPYNRKTYYTRRGYAV